MCVSVDDLFRYLRQVLAGESLMCMKALIRSVRRCVQKSADSLQDKKNLLQGRGITSLIYTHSCPATKSFPLRESHLFSASDSKATFSSSTAEPCWTRLEVERAVPTMGVLTAGTSPLGGHPGCHGLMSHRLRYSTEGPSWHGRPSPFYTLSSATVPEKETERVLGPPRTIGLLSLRRSKQHRAFQASGSSRRPES